MIQQIVDSAAWNVAGAVIILGTVAAAVYSYWDADQEEKGQGKYAES